MTSIMKHRHSLLVLVGCLIIVAGILSSCEQEEKEIAVTAVSINHPSVEMIIGESFQLSAQITPSDATEQEVIWSSSKQSVAIVDPTGLVTAIAEGVSTISASVGGKTGTCVVSVIKGFIAVESIELDVSELSMVEGDEYTLKATIKPDDATDKAVSWTSSDDKIAIVDNTGKVKAITPGEAVVRAKAGEKTADCKIVVSKKKINVTMVMLSKTTLTMIVGEEQTIIATIIPNNATVQTVQWSTSNPDVATVEDGKITAIKEGNAKIVATADGVSGECNVTVNYIPVQSITFDMTALSLYEGEEYTLTATIVPEDATYKDIKWTTSNAQVASIDNVKVVAIKKGTATIKAEANGKTASCQVEVHSSMASISLSKSEMSMIVGETATLTAVISPADATLRESITWASSNTNVVTVDDYGKVKAVKEGNAIISASVEGKKAECNVSVDYVHVSSITLNQNEATLYIGDNLSLSATLYPNNVTYNIIEWSSSNNAVVNVSNTGKVTAVGKGLATVSAVSDGKEAKCTFTVLVPLSGLSFDKTSIQLFDGQTAQLSVIMTPNDATLKGDIKWNSSNTSVATVTNDGLVTAIKKGTTNITASVDGYAATCSVEVLASVTGISLNKTSATLNRGESLKLSYSVTPTGATLQEQVSWVSTNTSVASVDNQGNVSAVGAGTADITVSLEGFTATCRITVVVPVNSVSLNKTALTIEKGNSETLVATINPSDATNQSLSWSSSNTAIATVDKDGRVTAIEGGDATITVSSNNGKTASCSVKVTTRVTGVSFNKTTLKLNPGESETLTATVTPSTAGNKSVTWTSNDTSIASVDQNGKVTGVAEGTATIIAITEDGGKMATCTVIVYEWYVDLGLSVCWASHNLGASSPEKDGDKYAWGETSSKTSFSWDNYKWSNYGSSTSFSKYNSSDNKTTLDLADDAAYVNLGEKWRIPTKSETSELISNCEIEEFKLNGVAGYKFTSKKAGYTDKWIFIPFAVNNNYSVSNVYWTRSLYRDTPYYSYGLTWNHKNKSYSNANRCNGLYIRPVHIK